MISFKEPACLAQKVSKICYKIYDNEDLVKHLILDASKLKFDENLVVFTVKKQMNLFQ